MSEAVAAPAAAPAASPAPAAGLSSQQPAVKPAANAQPTPNAAPTDGKPSADTPAVDAPPGWTKRDGKWYVTARVNEEDVEFDYDEAMHQLRTKESATRRWQEAARMEKQVKALLEGAAQSPANMAKLARELGMNPRELAEHILAEGLADEQLTPEQRRVRELEQRLAERERADAERMQAQEEAIRTQRVEAEQKHLVSQFDAQLDGLNASKSPKVRGMIHQRMAQLIQHHQANAIPTSLTRIAQQALADVQATASEFGGNVVQAPPPPVETPKRVVPPPPKAGEQGESRHGRDERGRFVGEPRPHFDPRIPGSLKALREWKQKYGG